MKRKQTKFMNIFGISGLSGAFFAGIVLFLSLLVDDVLQIPKIPLNETTTTIAVVLLLFWALLTLWTLKSLPCKIRGKRLVQTGIYKLVRHPLYTAGIFFLYPGFSLLLRSYTALILIIVVFMFFKLIVMFEERYMLKLFGREYKRYMRRVNGFIPVYKSVGRIPTNLFVG